MPHKDPKEATICRRCMYFKGTQSEKEGCNNPNAPYTDYVLGKKEPNKINRGKCDFFHNK